MKTEKCVKLNRTTADDINIYKSVLFSGEKQTALKLVCLHIISEEYCFEFRIILSKAKK